MERIGMRSQAQNDVFETGCEMVDATSAHRPDPSWRFTDAQGHVHQWSTNGEPAKHYSPSARYEVPTIRWHRDEPIIDEDGDEIPQGHNECVECGEHVVPGYTADTSVQMMPGLRWCKIDGVTVSPEEFKRRAREAGLTA